MCHTIVLAEAERDDAELILLAVDRANIDADVIVFSDGQSVVDFFLGIERKSAWHKHCDLLLLNWDLPQLDGIRVLRQLRWLRREDLAKLPPIVLLAHEEHEHQVADAYQYGADGFVCTRTTVSRLVAAIEQTLRYWLLTNRRPANGQPRTAARPAPALWTPAMGIRQ